MREDFNQDTIQKLKTRAGNICSFPNCNTPTCGPSEESATQTANTGVAAHICAASRGKGARRRLDVSKFDVKLLSDYSNGIWMCSTHAKLIDTDEVRFTVEMLRRWRELSELRAKLSHAMGRSIQLELRRGCDVPLAEVKRSVSQSDDHTLNDMCTAVLDSCIVDVWGRDLGLAVRDLVGELMINAFLHGGASQFKLDIDQNRVLIESNDAPYSFGQLLDDSKCRGGRQAAASLMRLSDRLITSYRREANSNVLEIVFIASCAQVLRATTCSITHSDFVMALQEPDQLPTIYDSCETIYVVLPPENHFIPSVARSFSESLKALAATNKRMVLIGSDISEGVIYTLKDAFPSMQVVQV